MPTSRAFLCALAITVAAAVSGYADTSAACGQCHGDKVAAVYDHAVVIQALKDGHGVEFAEVNGPFRMSGEDNAALLRETESFGGADKGTVRVSANPSAVSFAFDPKKGSAADMLAKLNKRLEGRKWTLAHLQTIGPAEKK